LQVLVAEGLHPFHDERVRDLLDVKIYLDISDDVKIAWKIQRDMKERGHSLESIKASIAARKHDFDAYIDPQKKHADIIIQVKSGCLLTARRWATVWWVDGKRGRGGPGLGRGTLPMNRYEEWGMNMSIPAKSVPFD